MTDTNTNTAPASAPQPSTEALNIRVGRTSLIQQFEPPKPGPQPKPAQEEAPKADTAQEQPPKQEELILGKFKSREDLEAAYKELERKLGQPKSEEAPKEEQPAKQEETPKAQDEAPKEEASQEKPEGGEVKDDKGQTIDISRYESEFLSNNALSEESYQELAQKHGIPKDVVDDVIQLRMERAERVKQEFYKAAGGEDNLKTILEWAGSSDTDPAIAAAYNKAIDAAKTSEDAILAIQGLRSRYESIKGVQPRRIVGENSSSLNTGGDNGAAYASEKEFQAARRDPRYAKDPVYRQAVAEKLSRSAWFQAEQQSRR